VEAIEDLSLHQTNSANGENKNGKQAVVKNQKANEDIYLRKLGRLLRLKKNQQLTLLKHVETKKENNSLNNQEVSQRKLKDLEDEIYN